MKITEGKIKDVLGLKKQKDLFNVPYFEYDKVGHFYYIDGGEYYFRADGEEDVVSGITAIGIITNWEMFERNYL